MRTPPTGFYVRSARGWGFFPLGASLGLLTSLHRTRVGTALLGADFASWAGFVGSLQPVSA